jgi:hypothetical protein
VCFFRIKPAHAASHSDERTLCPRRAGYTVRCVAAQSLQAFWLPNIVKIPGPRYELHGCFLGKTRARDDPVRSSYAGLRVAPATTSTC